MEYALGPFTLRDRNRLLHSVFYSVSFETKSKRLCRQIVINEFRVQSSDATLAAVHIPDAAVEGTMGKNPQKEGSLYVGQRIKTELS